MSAGIVFSPTLQKIGSFREGEVRAAKGRLMGSYAGNRIYYENGSNAGYFSNGTVFLVGGIKAGSCRNGKLYDADGEFLGTYEGDIIGAAASLLLLIRWLRDVN